jgi:glycosyltransferase involved in cell wall biosynthesis
VTHVHEISVVVPVYQGATTLPGLVVELAVLREPFSTPGGRQARLGEVLLVHDFGPDRSDVVVRDLAATYDWVRPVWLSRNFGQHAATLAGMASSGGDWVVTMDEDGQHDPRDIPGMLDAALTDSADVVYAAPLNPAPHGFLRNSASRLAKASLRRLTGNENAGLYHSYRLMLGQIARSVAAYAGSGVYLDVALGWVSGAVTTAPVTLRSEGGRPSGYRFRTLLSHYWRMILTGGTRLLRFVSLLGVLMAVTGFGLAALLVVARLTRTIPVAGWTSVMVAMLMGIGTVLFALGVVAEFVGVAVNMALGRPLYLIVSDREDGPHGWEARSAREAQEAGEAPSP